jgi:hypothetical protein
VFPFVLSRQVDEQRWNPLRNIEYSRFPSRGRSAYNKEIQTAFGQFQ